MENPSLWSGGFPLLPLPKNQILTRRVEIKSLWSRGPQKLPPPDGLDRGGEEEGRQSEIENGEVGVPADEQEDDKVKLRKPANPVQGEPAEPDGGEARDGEGDLGGLLEDEGLTSRKKGSFIPQEPAGNPDPDQQTTSKEEQRKEWKRMMEIAGGGWWRKIMMEEWENGGGGG